MVEIDSESEIKWVSYLLGINEQTLSQKLTYRITEARDEKVLTPLNIDQALDARYVLLTYTLMLQSFPLIEIKL